MKRTLQLLALAGAPAVLAGCAGYNTTMFMTKSNAGLDFDAKPPTLEINVSRKEAVIAPSFEGAQTPPVMASFKPKAGAGGGFSSFFFGVDQTFAGGDAAVAMSELYDKGTATDKNLYESALHLSKAPEYKNWFQSVPGPGKTRPFIFGTDTSLGLKVAWSGAGGQIPDTVKIGFNRKEFAWAPLSVTSPKTDAQGKPAGTAVDIKMPAFLATIESKQDIGTNSTNGIKVQALQYFATGDSAVYLAMQQDVRAAMLERMDPNASKRKAEFMEASSREGRTAVIRNIQGLYSGLQLQTADTAAQAFVGKLDKEGAKILSSAIPVVTPLKHYQFVGNTLTVKNNSLDDGSPNDFSKVIRLWSNLENSAFSASAAVAANTPANKILFQPPAPPNAPAPAAPAIGPNDEAELVDQAPKLQKEFDALDKALRTDDVLIAAAQYYAGTVMPH